MINIGASIAAPPSATTDGRHHPLVRVLHWAMALGFLFVWLSGWIMRDLMVPDSPAQEALHDLHKSVGATLILLLGLRLTARWRTAAPAPPAALSPLTVRLARLGHGGLYLLIALVAVTGWALTDFGGHGVVWFGLAMPQVFPMSETLLGVTLDPLTSEIHETLAYGLLGLVVVHVAAVAKHRWAEGVDLMPRIALWGRRR